MPDEFEERKDPGHRTGESASASLSSRVSDWPEVVGLQRGVARVALRSGMLSAVRSANNLVASRFELPAIWTSSISRLLTGPTIVTATLAAQEASIRINKAFTAPALQEQLQRSSALTIDAIQRQVNAIAHTAAILETASASFRPLQPEVSIERAVAIGLQGWDEATRSIAKDPAGERLMPLQAFGRGTLGITSAGLVLSEEPTDSEDDVQELLGPAAYAERLRDRLRELDPSLPGRLEGAWERVSRSGPDAGSQAAHSLMEVVDWALRLSAPDADVLAWHSRANRPKNEVRDNGEPTRSLRVRYLLRGRDREDHAARLHLRALTGLVDTIQSYKHAAGNKDVHAVARLIPTVEGFLIYVLL